MNVPLTPREVQVVELVAEGHSASRIAAALECRPRTVYQHVSNIAKKLPIKQSAPRSPWRRVLVWGIARQYLEEGQTVKTE